MPIPLASPVLTVDANFIHKIDTSNPQNLLSIWAVFNKCVDSVDQGRRLENLSWRLWTREALCAKEDEFHAISKPRNIPFTRIPDVPQLSGSVDSAADEDEAVYVSKEGVQVRPAIRRQDSCASSRSRERHITSHDLESMVNDIIKKREPLTSPLPQIRTPIPSPSFHDKPAPLERTGSTTTEESDKTNDDRSDTSQLASSPDTHSSMKTTRIVHGFSPAVSSPFSRALSAVGSQGGPQVSYAIPEPSSSPAAKVVQPKKGAKFALGPDSFSDASSSTNSVRPSSMLAPPKHTTTKMKMARSIQESSAVADDSDTDQDHVNESAIDDDDDCSDWEDSAEDSGKSSFDDRSMFRRVDSRANLTSRRSLITLMIKHEHTQRLSNHSSLSTSALHASQPRAATHTQVQARAPQNISSPNDSDESPLMMKKVMRGTPLKPINEVTRTAAQPILSTNNLALSPRTTRRNMLGSELTESLRRHLLWERQQKSSTANAVLKRRHTSHDVANLKQYPERPCMKKSEDVNASSWNEYWTKEAFNGYHTQGW